MFHVAVYLVALGTLGGPGGPGYPGWLRNGVILAVLGMWVAAMVASILRPDYAPSPFIHPIAGGVIGAALGIDPTQWRRK